MKKDDIDNEIKNKDSTGGSGFVSGGTIEPAEGSDAYTGGGPADLREADALAEAKFLERQENEKKQSEKDKKKSEGYFARRRRAREDNDPTHGSAEVYDELLDEEGEFSEEYIASGNEDLPTAEQLETELKREINKRRFRRILRTTIGTLVVIAAAAVLVAMIWLPVFRIYGNSMNSTLEEGQIVVAMKGNQFKNGDVIAFYYGNKLMVKRVIAGPGQKVDIDDNGNVFVDDQPLSEPYVTNKSLGDCNIFMPYEVPDNRYFLMGDNRDTSLDSRNTSVGCISDEQIVGKVAFRVWPLNKFGGLKGAND